MPGAGISAGLEPLVGDATTAMTITRLQKAFAPFKRFLPRAVWQPMRSLATGVITPIRFSVRTGHWRSSMAMAACSAGGAPIPWYTYPCIDFLAQRTFEDRNVLEFGGGQSTLWWSTRAHSVLTIEENADWYARLTSQIRSNVSLQHVPLNPETHSRQIKGVIDANPVRAFDIIVVDGHLRQESAALAFDYLAPNGAIILDNSEGYGFYEEIKSRSCRRIDFFGFAPGVSLRHCTSIVFVDDCFLLQPDIPVPVIELLPH